MIQLRPEQEEAVEKLRTGSILVGGVGSGKSITALAYFYNKVCRGDYTKRSTPLKPRPLYIITTAFKRDTLDWNKECARFGLSTDSSCSVGGISVVIDSWNNIKKYVGTSGAFFIFDEQRVVGSGAWVRAFLKLAKSNAWILLSATPGDTWSDYIPVFIANGFYRNKTEFCQEHCVYNKFTNFTKIERYINTGRLILYRSKILIDMDYVKSTTQNHMFITCGYDKSKYDRVVKDRWNIYEDCPIENASQLCYLMRKVVNSDKRRLIALEKILEQKSKLIIFYNFDYELEMLREFAKDIDILCQEWNGHKHELVPQGDKWIYLVQYASGSEAWNCIETDAMVFYSQNYSYKTMKQSAGRIDRRNTPYKNLYYYHLVSKSSIDNGIRNTLNKKKDFNESKFFAKLSREKNLAYNREKG